jgi:hypothetical protein
MVRWMCCIVYYRIAIGFIAEVDGRREGREGRMDVAEVEGGGQ